MGDSFVLDIAAEVVTPSPQASLLAVLSWARAGVRDSCEFEFRVEAQREDVDWERVELTEPYSLEAVTSENDLIGRKTELRQLRRLANLKAVAVRPTGQSWSASYEEEEVEKLVARLQGLEPAGVIQTRRPGPSPLWSGDPTADARVT